MRWLRIACLVVTAFAFMFGQVNYAIALLLMIIADQLNDLIEEIGGGKRDG